MWFKTRPSNVTLLEQTKKKFTYDFIVNTDPKTTFKLVSEPALLERWIPGFQAAKWLTERKNMPHAIREVRLQKVGAHEKILVWEPGERFVYCIIQLTLPILVRLIEDYRFEAVEGEPQQTRVYWTVAYQTKWSLSGLEKLFRQRISKLFEASALSLSSLSKEELSDL